MTAKPPLLLALALAACGGSKQEEDAAAAEAYLANVERQEEVNAARVEAQAKVRDEIVTEAAERGLEAPAENRN